MRLAWLGWVGFVLGACGGSGSTPGAPDASPADARLPTIVDAGIDADYGDARPPRDDAGVLLFDPGVVLDRVALAEDGHAWAPYAPLANTQFQQRIDDGLLILLVEFRGLDDPSGQDDPDGLSVGLFTGVDVDGNVGDNFTGQEELEVDPSSLDPNGNPRALLPGATLADGQLAGSDPGPLLLFLPGIGELEVYDVDFAALLIAPVGGGQVRYLQNGTISGVLLARDLAAMPNALDATCLGGNLLDVIAVGCLAVDGVQPDVDRDGDGLETFEDDDGDWELDLCHDGDGTTYASLPGLPCALDGAFQDGYSVTLEVEGVRVVIRAPGTAQP